MKRAIVQLAMLGGTAAAIYYGTKRPRYAPALFGAVGAVWTPLLYFSHACFMEPGSEQQTDRCRRNAIGMAAVGGAAGAALGAATTTRR